LFYARRLIEQKGVKVDGETVENINLTISKNEVTIQKGKKVFLKVKFN